MTDGDSFEESAFLMAEKAEKCKGQEKMKTKSTKKA